MISVLLTMSGVTPLPDPTLTVSAPSPAGPTVEDIEEDVSFPDLGFRSTVIISEEGRGPLRLKEDTRQVPEFGPAVEDVIVSEFISGDSLESGEFASPPAFRETDSDA